MQTPVPKPDDFGQSEVLAFLGNPESHGLTSAPVRIDTHGAIVFLAGNDVYKVKRAVKYPYMDFSTLSRRKAACEAEMDVNRRNAPNIYLDVVPITRCGQELKLGGQGPVVEWAVHMRRFDETATFDRLADRHELTHGLVDSLVQAVLKSHEGATLHRSTDVLGNMEKVIAQTIGELEARCGRAQQGTISKLAGLLRDTLRANQPVLAGRAAAGYVRRCHGDLHLRNIVLVDGKPTLFDAIEFDVDIATVDILYDLAFLVMDLQHRGLREPACRLLNRYLWASPSQHDDIAALSLLPMYLALRASIRAAVLAAQAGLTTNSELPAEIFTYLGEAVAYLEPARAHLIAIGGLSGSGKSTISDLLASRVGSAPGAVQLRSDIERKKRFGVQSTARLGPGAYDRKVSDSVYGSLYDLAAAAIRAGRTVIVDATFLEEPRRTKIQRLAADAGITFSGIWLGANALLLKSRLQSRGEDASDATATVLELQLQKDIGILNWHAIDSSQPKGQIISEILKLIALDERKDMPD